MFLVLKILDKSIFGLQIEKDDINGHGEYIYFYLKEMEKDSWHALSTVVSRTKQYTRVVVLLAISRLLSKMKSQEASEDKIKRSPKF